MTTGRINQVRVSRIFSCVLLRLSRENLSKTKENGLSLLPKFQHVELRCFIDSSVQALHEYNCHDSCITVRKVNHTMSVSLLSI